MSDCIRTCPKAVIFDMDGTITVPVLDFRLMRAEIGIESDEGLLESMSAMDAAARERAERILLSHELTAARDSCLNDGVTEVLEALRRRDLRTAILTRNCRRSADIVIEKHGLRFDALVTREDTPPKPLPDGVHAAAGMMGVAPEECVVVGDYEFDIIAGRDAGAVTVLFAPQGRLFRTVPDFEIRSMRELPPLLDGIIGG